MNKKRVETTQKQDTSFNNTSSSSVGDSPDIQSFRGWQPQADPSIPYRFARARTNLNQSFNNPAGQYSTPAIREATQRSAEGDLMQQEGQAMRESQNDVNAQTGAKEGFLASLTAPRTTTSSGTGASSGSGNQVSSGGLIGDLALALAQGGSSGASSALA